MSNQWFSKGRQMFCDDEDIVIHLQPPMQTMYSARADDRSWSPVPHGDPEPDVTWHKDKGLSWKEVL